jgi:hypothetical protein
MTWSASEFEAGWRFIAKLMDVYKPNSTPFAVLCEALRLIEVEMREEGHGKLVERLHA